MAQSHANQAEASGNEPDFYDGDGPDALGGNAHQPEVWNRYLWNPQMEDALLAEESISKLYDGFPPVYQGDQAALWWALPDRLGSIADYVKQDENVTYDYSVSVRPNT
jgi:hypothetical protein